jgi:hypothetical protein
MSVESGVIFTENVAIVQSQDSKSLVPPTISAEDFFKFTGDTRYTIQIEGFPSEAVEESPWSYIRTLFGAWVESGNEDKQLQDLYQSRVTPSSIPQDE